MQKFLTFLLFFIGLILPQTASFHAVTSLRRPGSLHRAGFARVPTSHTQSLSKFTLAAVLDIESEVVFDKTIASAKSALVVVDYS